MEGEGEGEGEGVGIGVGVSLGFGVRKGAWTKDEDTLLTKCIEQYGEGKWHLVPSRAGLNRYRKSCRMRWLNYLKPSIKRGEFADDEVDLIIRLHNLLGNRWSLIAGRLPGRTANDIKNYWNSHLLKKMTSPHSKKIISKLNPNPNPNPNLNPSNPNNNMVIRPRPRRLSTKSFPLLQGKNNHDTNDNDVEDVTTNNNLLTDEVAGAGASAKSMNGEVPWWELLLMEDGNEVDNEQQKHQTVYHCHINNNNQSGSMGEEAFLNGPVVEEPNDICNWDLLFSDVDLWKGFK